MNQYESWLESQKKLEQQKRQQADIKRLGGKYNYLNFTENNYNNKKILSMLVDFPNKSFYLFGKAGTGKTHASVATARRFPMAQFITLGDLALKVRACPDAREEIAVMDYYSSVPLVLDDVGAEKPTEFVQNLLYRLFDNRIKNMQQGLIVTSNKDINGLEQCYGSRIVSRLLGIVGENIIEITGKDHRIGGIL